MPGNNNNNNNRRANETAEDHNRRMKAKRVRKTPKTNNSVKRRAHIQNKWKRIGTHNGKNVYINRACKRMYYGLGGWQLGNFELVLVDPQQGKVFNLIRGKNNSLVKSLLIKWEIAREGGTLGPGKRNASKINRTVAQQTNNC